MKKAILILAIALFASCTKDECPKDVVDECPVVLKNTYRGDNGVVLGFFLELSNGKTVQVNQGEWYIYLPGTEYCK